MRTNAIAISKKDATGVASCLVLLVSTCLTGCGLGVSPTTSAPTNAGVLNFQGKVFGGQQPVTGATIQLYTVATTVNANGTPTASIPLITGPAITSGAGGSFTITNTYSCTSATQVYITATGGNAGVGNNTAIALMAALGPCSALTPNTNILINELTTVAAAYALAPFSTDYQHVGAAGSNPPGLVNAFNASQLLVNTTSGSVAAAPTGVTLPAIRLNTLADIIAACINTAGSNSSNCTTLLTTTGASETIGAALAIAKSPGSSAFTSLYMLASATPPFVPILTSQPADFTLAINYTGSELASPYGIAIDSGGNAWVTNEAGRSVVKAPSLSTAFATTTFGNGGLLAPRGISIDRTGNVWIANTGGNNVVELGSGGGVLSGGGFSAGGINAPVAIANDSAGNAWIANFNGNSITELGSSGTASGSSPITGSTALSAPSSIALDASGRVLVGNEGTGQLCIFSNTAVLQNCISDGLLFGGTAVAVGTGGSVTLSGSTTGSTLSGAFTLGTSAGTVVASSPGLGGGLALPVAVAYAGNGNAWFANTSSISQFSGLTALSPASGFGSLSTPEGIAVDASGNIWTANAGDNSLSVFIGIAAPVVTPLAANVGP